MQNRAIRWATGTWEECSEAATEVRRKVFGEEMGIDEAIDFDGSDHEATHVVAFQQQLPVGCGRLQPPEGRIGRMAVLAGFRGRGLGTSILHRLLREAVRAGIRTLQLHAQEHAIDFYRRHGFAPEGLRFLEAGIRHQKMKRQLAWMSAVAGVVTRDGKVLLGRRAPHVSMGGFWDLFGGKIDPGETELEALQRELAEEVSLEVTPGAPLGVIIYDDCQGRGLWRCPVFAVTEWKGEVSTNEEHDEVGWFAPAEMARLRLAHERLIHLAEQALAQDR